MNNDLPRSLKLVTVWLLVGAAVFVAIQWWQHRAQQTRFQVSGGAMEIRRSDDGHYHWPGRINGRPVDFLIDTGATGTAIPASLAEDLELESRGSVRSSTAGGVVTGRLVRGPRTAGRREGRAAAGRRIAEARRQPSARHGRARQTALAAARRRAAHRTRGPALSAARTRPTPLMNTPFRLALAAALDIVATAGWRLTPGAQRRRRQGVAVPGSLPRRAMARGPIPAGTVSAARDGELPDAPR